MQAFVQSHASFLIAALAVGILFFCAIGPYASSAIKEMSKSSRFLFLFAFALATLYGGAKHKTGEITFPFTDSEVRYLIDNGSYVTNDAVHVAFYLIIAPSSAPLLIDRRQVGLTNDTDWVTFTNTTFAAFNQPQTIPFPAATNYDWIVYTTWTPGPTVQTNGVWRAYWTADQKTRSYFVPVRTSVYDGNSRIAPPSTANEVTK